MDLSDLSDFDLFFVYFQVALDGERLRVDELQVALGEVESERDNLLDMKDKIELTQRKLSEVEEREILLLKDIDDIKGKHAFAQAEFEKERDELNDVVTKSKLLLQVRFFFSQFLDSIFHRFSNFLGKN